MKKCPKCEAQYYDNTLEFCLEDGSHLLADTQTVDEVPTVVTNKIKEPLTTDKTAILPESKIPKNYQKIDKSQNNNQLDQKNDDNKLSTIKETVTHQGYKIIEVAPIFFALFHNYWQWIYFDKSRYSDTLSFLISGTFIVWFLFLILGTISSFIALKFGKNRGFAITALVILAINLLLSIVPLK